MRTTLDINETLLKEAMKCSGAKSKTSVVNRALEEWVRQQKLQGLLELEGKIEIEDNWRQMEEAELKSTRSKGAGNHGRR